MDAQRSAAEIVELGDALEARCAAAGDDVVTERRPRFESHRPLLIDADLEIVHGNLIDARRLATDEIEDAGDRRACDELACFAAAVIVERWRQHDADLGVDFLCTSWLCAYHADAEADVSFPERWSARRKALQFQRTARKAIRRMPGTFSGG